jgi:hypothetical protein
MGPSTSNGCSNLSCHTEKLHSVKRSVAADTQSILILYAMEQQN